MHNDKSSVLIVGGGLAGLCTAYELQRRGIPSHILEAASRLGGRVRTVHRSDGSCLDLGGELTGVHHRLWMHYVREFKLGLVDSGFYSGTAVVTAHGNALSHAAVDMLNAELERACAFLSEDAQRVDAERPWNSANATSWDHLSVGQWVDGLDISDLGKQILRAELETGNGTPANSQSYLALLAQIAGGGLSAFWEETAKWRCREGAEALVRGFVERIGIGNITLNTPVEAIRWSDGIACVTCADGCEYFGRCVVVAVPPNILQKIRFAPDIELPCSAQMGDAVKSLVSFKGPLPPAMRGYGDGALSTVWTTSRSEQESVFACLSGGPAAGALRSAPNLAEAIELGVRQFFPNRELAVQEHNLCDWGAVPWIEGSYSFPFPGQITRMRDFWLRPRNGLHFCGEHTDHAFVGFMEGALRSGARVAEAIAESLSSSCRQHR